MRMAEHAADPGRQVMSTRYESAGLMANGEEIAAIASLRAALAAQKKDSALAAQQAHIAAQQTQADLAAQRVESWRSELSTQRAQLRQLSKVKISSRKARAEVAAQKSELAAQLSEAKLSAEKLAAKRADLASQKAEIRKARQSIAASLWPLAEPAGQHVEKDMLQLQGGNAADIHVAAHSAHSAQNQNEQAVRDHQQAMMEARKLWEHQMQAARDTAHPCDTGAQSRCNGQPFLPKSNEGSPAGSERTIKLSHTEQRADGCANNMTALRESDGSKHSVSGEHKHRQHAAKLHAALDAVQLQERAAMEEAETVCLRSEGQSSHLQGGNSAPEEVIVRRFSEDTQALQDSCAALDNESRRQQDMFDKMRAEMKDLQSDVEHHSSHAAELQEALHTAHAQHRAAMKQQTLELAQMHWQGRVQTALDAAHHKYEEEFHEAQTHWQERLEQLEGEKVALEELQGRVMLELKGLRASYNALEADNSRQEDIIKQANAQIKQLESELHHSMHAMDIQADLHFSGADRSHAQMMSQLQSHAVPSAHLEDAPDHDDFITLPQPPRIPEEDELPPVALIMLPQPPSISVSDVRSYARQHPHSASVNTDEESPAKATQSQVGIDSRCSLDWQVFSAQPASLNAEEHPGHDVSVTVTSSTETEATFVAHDEAAVQDAETRAEVARLSQRLDEERAAKEAAQHSAAESQRAVAALELQLQQSKVSDAKLELERTRSVAAERSGDMHDLSASLCTQEFALVSQLVSLVEANLVGQATTACMNDDDEYTLYGDATRAVCDARVRSMQKTEAGLKVVVRQLEAKSERVQAEVHAAEEARNELGSLRRHIQHSSARKDDLDSLVRDLQQQELNLRMKISRSKSDARAACEASHNLSQFSIENEHGL